jgi:phage shock protein E
MKKLIKRKFLFLCLAIVMLVLAACAPSTPQSEPEGSGVAVPQQVERISLEESKAAFDSDSALFLDVRSEAAYEASHIPGAVSIPLQFLEPRISELDPDQWIITYCT